MFDIPPELRTYTDEPRWHDDERPLAIKGIIAGVCLSVPLWIGLWVAFEFLTKGE